jgi:hypothetical protein
MTRRDLIRAHLREHPQQTSGEIGLAIGCKSGSLRTLLVSLRRNGELVSADRWAPLMGRSVSEWSIAPPGTIPAPEPVPDPERERRRRERERTAKHRSRAKNRGEAPPGLQRSGRFLLPAAVPIPDFSQGACVGEDPELFFSPDEDDIARAESLCHGCPARVACRQWADANGERFGIWAGEDRSVRPLQVAS